MLEVDKIRLLIEQINGLDGEELRARTAVQIQLGGLISACCDLIRGMEKEVLSNSEIFQFLTQCKYVKDKYKTIGTNFADIDYLAEIVSIAKAVDENQAKFYLAEEVLYLVPNTVHFKSIDQRSVLLIGEKDFSFAYSYAITHKDERVNLIASEYQMYSYYGNLSIEFNDAITYLLDNKVVIAYGMDATKLHEYNHLYDGDTEGRFKRIQFNCPYDPRDRTKEGSLEKAYTKNLVDSFMASAKKLLHKDGRLHVSIQQPQNASSIKWGKVEYQEAYGLHKSALMNQFELVKVMGDIKARYSYKVCKSLEGKEPLTIYIPFLGQGKEHRVNQFIFKNKDSFHYFDYTTDSGTDSEQENVVEGRRTRMRL